MVKSTLAILDVAFTSYDKLVGAHLFKTTPTFMYGFVLFMCAISYYLL
ncbi:hypothetical protein A5869_001808 [Enterococcus cecorum]|uniref:Uncharacterized protein n=1 Tax=Enterococcus cecorum TaxID=44008 RepID=A0A200HQY5_9ENTE|nr:hypothetical protein A5869_001808 [Enterococcus cecorum]